MTSPIELEDATKIYGGGRPALDAASFTIARGERACLLGPNGAGKTTLIRLLTGALRPTRGSARLFGLAAHEPTFLVAKRRVGIVPQAAGMYRDFTVGEYLELVRELYGRGNVAAVAEAFGLGEYRARPMAQLSGGYQRRLTLAAAVLSEPDLLLLDEPTAGLDPVAAREVHDYLRAMMAGRTTLLCTHNLAEAEALCESVVILQGGHVLLHESVDALRKRASPQVELAAAQGPARLARELAECGYTPRSTGDTVRITVTDPQLETPMLLRRLLAAELDIYECHTRRPSLEDVFLELVGGSHAHA